MPDGEGLGHESFICAHNVALDLTDAIGGVVATFFFLETSTTTAFCCSIFGLAIDRLDVTLERLDCFVKADRVGVKDPIRDRGSPEVDEPFGGRISLVANLFAAVEGFKLDRDGKMPNSEIEDDPTIEAIFFC